jgi:hypothetical protein
MKTEIIHLTAAIMVMIAGTGCFWNRSAAVVRARYDLPERKAREVCSLPLRLGVVKNYSGSRSNFTLRQSDDRIVEDEQRNWLIPPELMLEREFRTKFLTCGESEQLVSVDALICRFELTESGKYFDLTVVYQLRNRRKMVNVLSRKHIAVGSEGAAAAASEGFERSFGDVIKVLPEFGIKLKNAGESR